MISNRAYKNKKLSNKATLSLCLLSKCSFTPSKLRFFELRKPKISSCYTTSKTNEAVHKTYWTAPLILLCDVHYNFSP